MNIGIVGLGLIGGSLGLDLRSLGHKVLGVSRRHMTCRVAKERGIVDESDVELKLMASAEVLFICTPISLIAPTDGCCKLSDLIGLVWQRRCSWK